MPLSFKAPLAFFDPANLPVRCLITGRTDNLRCHDLQLPFLRDGLTLRVLRLQPRRTPPSDPAVPTPAPLHWRPESIWRELWSLFVWLLLVSWPGYLVAGASGAAVAGLLWLTWLLIYKKAIKPGRQRRIEATAHYFCLPVAEPTSREWRQFRLRQVLCNILWLLYWPMLVLMVTASSRDPNREIYTGLFWALWIGSMLATNWMHRPYPLLILNPKSEWLEIRFANRHRDLYEEYCTRFMRWKQATHAATDIHYDIDDWPDESPGDWDQSAPPPDPRP